MNNNSKIPIFLQRGRIGTFLSVVCAGQFAYSSFEALKGSLMLPLTQAIGIDLTQFSYMMSMLGLATFLYVPGGWVNNRFPIRTILVTWLSWRMVTGLAIYLIPGLSFKVMIAIAVTWGIWDAIGWPAVPNGVAFASRESNEKGKGLAMGLLESIRRALEFGMNIIIIAMLAIWKDKAVQIVKWMGVLYTLIIIPNILAILKYVPKNEIAHSDGFGGDNVAALKGLLVALSKPQIWLAGIAGLCVYWGYMNLIYCSAPYITLVYGASDAVAGTFGIINTGLLGILAGVIAGSLSDYVFKTSTRMLGISLLVVAIGVALVRFMPGNGNMWGSMVLLMVMSIGVFMGKSVLMAPIAELNLPESINGSAMSVGSFLVYASIFWAPAWNAKLIESNPDPRVGYEKIFMITMVVALVGAACSFLLIKGTKKQS